MKIIAAWKIQFASLALCAIGFGAPQKVWAHGELLIRIGAATEKIAVATNSAQLYLERGELYREDKNWAAAKADYDQTTALDPGLSDKVNFCRAKMLDDSGELETSRAMFTGILSNSPTDGEALVGRARVLIKLNQRPAAIQDYQNGIEHLTKPQPEYFLELAQALSADGKPVEALLSLDQGIGVYGPLISLQTFALDLELAQKNYDTAIVRVDTIIERSIRKEDWLAKRADILLAAGRLTEAQKSFEAALSAISILPWRLQQGLAMQNLQSRIGTALSGITNAPALGKTE